MTINLNTQPYYDDFDGDKNYHHILFKPGYAVQARELTQIQSILKDQIKKFGDHIFKHGSIVIPGNSYADLAAQYVRVNRTYLGSSVNFSLFENATIVNQTGVTAVIRLIQNDGGSFVDFYINYISGGTLGVPLFSTGDILEIPGLPGAVVSVSSESNAVGVGSIAVVNSGVYYVNGVFGYVPKQAIVISPYDSLPSCSVVLKISENIVTSNEDSTLLDPAQGSYNFSAPGADRIQLVLELQKVDLGAPILEDSIELMRYSDGELLEHARNPRYSELDKSLARRTYDESGDYVVNGFSTTIKEHLKDGNNGGVYAAGDKDKLIVEISPGKAYIQGYEIDKLAKTRIEIDKGRSEDHIKATSILTRPRFGSYLYITDLTGANFSIANHEKITLWNSFDSGDVTAVQIGEARIIGIDYYAGDPNDNPIYLLHISDLVISPGYTMNDFGGARFGVGGSMTVLSALKVDATLGTYTVDETVTADASGYAAKVTYWDQVSNTVFVYKHSSSSLIPRAGDVITSSVSNITVYIQSKTAIVNNGHPAAVFPIPKTPVYSLKNELGAIDIEYTVQKELNIATDETGAGSTSISNGVIDPIEVGSFVAISASGLVSASLFSVNTSGNTLTITGGPVSDSIKVFCNVTKTNLAPKTKTLSTHTETVTATSNKIQLSKYDVVRVISVIKDSVDVTANFALESGQTAYRYELGYLIPNNGTLVPSGDYDINYEYYSHSITGDYFCVDSYAGNTDYLDSTPTFDVNNNNISLLQCIDFRPGVGSNNELSGAGAIRNDMLVPDSIFSSALQFFVPRIDVVVVNKNSSVEVIRGVPAEYPDAKNVSQEQLALDLVLIPAYTFGASSVTATRVSVNRYTMRDIKKIEDRIDRLEEFSTITSAEVATAQYEVIDAATGLNRFKSGYLVENFEQPLAIARTTREDFSTSFIGNGMHAAAEVLMCNLIPLSFEDVVDSGGYMMLPYTEEVFANQPLSSRITNINPYMVVSWNGLLSVFPPSDEWVDVLELPTIFETQEEIVIIPAAPCPPPPPPPPAPPPPPMDSPLLMNPIISSANVTNGDGVKTSSSTFTVTNLNNADVTVIVQAINVPTGGFVSIVPSSFSLTVGETKSVTATYSSPSNLASSYSYTVAAVANEYDGRFPMHVHTQVKVEPPPPPPPQITYTMETTYGGYYGAVLGRPAEPTAVTYYSDYYRDYGLDRMQIEFYNGAVRNFNRGAEQTLNPMSPGELDSIGNVLSSQTDTKYEITTYADGTVSKRAVSSVTTGIRVDGSTFTR